MGKGNAMASEPIKSLPGAEMYTVKALEAWKQQFDASLRFMEAMTESAMKVHESQLEAASDAHANAIATQRSAAKACDPAELLRIQSEWAMHNLQEAAAYWRELYELSLQTNAALLECLTKQGKAS